MHASWISECVMPKDAILSTPTAEGTLIWFYTKLVYDKIRQVNVLMMYTQWHCFFRKNISIVYIFTGNRVPGSTQNYSA